MSRHAPLALALLSACSFEGTWHEPTPGLHRMIDQRRVDTYEASAFFDDGMSMRAPPEGTVPFGAAPDERAPALDRALLLRGQDRFGIFCAPCHGLDARARTPIAVDMALRPPPALIEPRLVAVSDAAPYAVITQGYGLMPAYADRLAPRDRWAVVGYVRALQLGSAAPIEWLSPADRQALARSGS